MIVETELLRLVCKMPLFEDMAPWNLMVTDTRVEYVDSENRNRTLDDASTAVGVLSLYFQTFEEMARLFGLCVGDSGTTLYGKSSIPYVAACMGGEFAEQPTYPCGHTLDMIPCHTAQCAPSFDQCMRASFV
jgi:hypothetical protein